MMTSEYYIINVEYIRMDIKRQFIMKFKIKEQADINIVINILVGLERILHIWNRQKNTI